VYKVAIPSGLMVAVKRFKSAEKISAASFSSEIGTLAIIRHRNIVRLLGWGANQKTKLLFYDYMANGTLGTLLHEANDVGLVEWEMRIKIALGVAEGLAYLHHDCVPPILHRDVKSHNILLGDRYEACLADFGLAREVEDEHGSFSASPQFAGSYGYIAPGEFSFFTLTRL
jgi:serine/threonine protein kinase